MKDPKLVRAVIDGINNRGNCLVTHEKEGGLVQNHIRKLFWRIEGERAESNGVGRGADYFGSSLSRTRR